MSLESKRRELLKLKRDIYVETLLEWGLPFGKGSRGETALVLDVIDLGPSLDRWYFEVVFRAPDDDKTYKTEYSLAMEEGSWGYWDETHPTCYRVEPRTEMVTVVVWDEIIEQPAPTSPTVAQLKAKWRAQRADDAAAAEDATW